MMSLGAGALKIGGGPNAISREEVSMATLSRYIKGVLPLANRRYSKGVPFLSNMVKE